MIELKITADTPAKLHDTLRALLAGTAEVTVTGSPQALRAEEVAAALAQAQHPSPTKGKPTETKDAASSDTNASGDQSRQEAPSSTDAGQSSGPTATTDASRSEGAAEGPLTYEDHIKPGVLKVSQKLKREGVVALLAKFEVENAKDVPPAKWPDLMTEINKLLED